MKRWLIGLICVITSLTTQAQSENDFAYYGLEPDIITNYINYKKKLGYVRLTVELMIEDSNNMSVVEHHAPLLRDAIVEILGKESEDQVKSLIGREEIRQKCLIKLRTLLKEETGQEILKDIIFTKYLYH